jgi:hypothetical protein
LICMKIGARGALSRIDLQFKRARASPADGESVSALLRTKIPDALAAETRRRSALQMLKQSA